MLKKIIVPIISIAVTLIIVKLFIFNSPKNNSDIEYQKYFNRYYKVLSPEIPKELDFAGEKVPLDLFYVRESLDKELILNTYWQSRTLLLLKRANRWFPVIEPILKENGVPDDFKYMAAIESELENQVSNVGASGIWQFMKETGQKYGLEINDYVDERYHLEKSTLAACNYLKNAYKIYGNWTLAAASFNAGENGISSRIDYQKADNFYNMNFPPETARYIYRILAIKLILENPTKYGYYLRTKDLYPAVPTYTVDVDSSISDLAEFAVSNKENYKILKEFNPWLRKPNLVNKSHKKYSIRFPQEGFLYYSKLQSNIEDNGLFYKDTVKMDQLR